jgi:hypothetical protein
MLRPDRTGAIVVAPGRARPARPGPFAQHRPILIPAVSLLGGFRTPTVVHGETFIAAGRPKTFTEDLHNCGPVPLASQLDCAGIMRIDPGDCTL